MNDNLRRTATFSTLALTLVRVVLGVFWILQFDWKPPPQFGCPDQGLCLWLDKEIQHPLIPLYGEFVRVVARPNAIPLGWVTLIVETGIGLALVFGVFTRLGALVGTLWSLNLLIGLANVPGEQGWYYAFLIMLNFVYVALGGGPLSADRVKGRRIWWARAEPSPS